MSILNGLRKVSESIKVKIAWKFRTAGKPIHEIGLNEKTSQAIISSLVRDCGVSSL
jgi:hypothetical protein